MIYLNNVEKCKGSILGYFSIQNPSILHQKNTTEAQILTQDFSSDSKVRRVLLEIDSAHSWEGELEALSADEFPGLSHSLLLLFQHQG